MTSALAPLKFRGYTAWLNEDHPLCLHGQRVSQPDGRGDFPAGGPGRGDYQVLSAGLGAVEGQPPSPYAVQAVKELGIDIGQPAQPDADAGAGAAGRLHLRHDPQPRGHGDAVVSAGGGEDLPAARIRRNARHVREGHQRSHWRLVRGLSNCRDQIEQGIVSLLRFIEKGAAHRAARRRWPSARTTAATN